MADPSDEPSVATSPRIILFHEAIYGLDLDDETEVAETQISFADAEEAQVDTNSDYCCVERLLALTISVEDRKYSAIHTHRADRRL